MTMISILCIIMHLIESGINIHAGSGHICTSLKSLVTIKCYTMQVHECVCVLKGLKKSSKH